MKQLSQKVSQFDKGNHNSIFANKKVLAFVIVVNNCSVKRRLCIQTQTALLVVLYVVEAWN